MGAFDRSLVILAGGRSSRLGQDKVFLEIAGRPPLLRALDATHGLDVVVAVRKVSPFRAMLEANSWESVADNREVGATMFLEGRTLRIVPDPKPDWGPVAGLASGLAAAQGRLVLVLAGDLPFVTEVFVDQIFNMLAADRELDAVVPFVNGHFQPLCAAYRRTVRETAEALLAESLSGGESMSMMHLLEQVKVRKVGSNAFSDVIDLATLTRGIDTPRDLSWAEETAAKYG